MKFWLVERTDDVGYDEYDSHVVLANDADEARRLASGRTGDEGATPWLTATVEPLEAEGEPMVIHSSFRAS